MDRTVFPSPNGVIVLEIPPDSLLKETTGWGEGGVRGGFSCLELAAVLLLLSPSPMACPYLLPSSNQPPKQHALPGIRVGWGVVVRETAMPRSGA